MAKEKVLITGGAGYIGSVLTKWLLDNDYQVTCLDDLRYNQKSLTMFADNSNFNFIYGDVRNKRLLENIISNFDFILPLAAIVGMPACKEKPLEAESINRDAIIVIKDLIGFGQSIIFPTTNSGYGTRSDDIFCTEETPIEPISLYGKS